jgi:hypothetical protein
MVRRRDDAAVWLLVIAVLIGGAGCSRASAEEGTVTSVDWTTTHPLSGAVSGGTVEIRATDAGGSFLLVSIDRPAVGDVGYVLGGDVRYRGVHPAGFIEMWSVFPDGTRFFSKTVARQGPQASLDGDAEARPFEVPFSLAVGSPPPTRLDVVIVLPGAGTVWVGPLRLTSMRDADAGAWWSDRNGGLIGGVAGSVLGLTGAILGVFIGRRKHRSLVLAGTAVLTVGGLVVLTAGLWALASSQPYAVWYPLLLGGGLSMIVFGGTRRLARHAYTDAELRRMRAADLSRP